MAFSWVIIGRYFCSSSQNTFYAEFYSLRAHFEPQDNTLGYKYDKMYANFQAEIGAASSRKKYLC